VFEPINIALPSLVGVIADCFGLTWALLALLMQPVVLLTVALASVVGSRGRANAHVGWRR
jgi:hypothetical protein